MSSEDLEEAVRRGDLESIRRLVQEEGVDVNSTFHCGRTALHLAVFHRKDEIVELLLEINADVHARSRWGETPLHVHIARRGSIGVLQLLLDYKADANVRTRHGETAFYCAIRSFAKRDVLQLLLDHEADINACDKHGVTALHCALRRRGYAHNSGLFRFLLENNADANARDESGKTPLHYALRYLSDLEVLQCLIDSKADINAADRCGNTPLHWISFKGATAPVMELLLSHHADVHARDQDQNTPLHVLVRKGCTEAVTVLLDHLRVTQDTLESALIMCATKQDGSLPFHLVRSPAMAKLLLEQPLITAEDQLLVPRACPAMLFAKDRHGRTLLDLHPKGPLHDYLASFTKLPLTVPAASATHYHQQVAVRLNPMLNEFQHSIAEAFLKEWDGWSTLFLDGISAEDTDYYLLPVELKRSVMAYLSPADVMLIRVVTN